MKRFDNLRDIELEIFEEVPFSEVNINLPEIFSGYKQFVGEVGDYEIWFNSQDSYNDSYNYCLTGKTGDTRIPQVYFNGYWVDYNPELTQQVISEIQEKIGLEEMKARDELPKKLKPYRSRISIELNKFFCEVGLNLSVSEYKEKVKEYIKKEIDICLQNIEIEYNNDCNQEKDKEDNQEEINRLWVEESKGKGEHYYTKYEVEGNILKVGNITFTFEKPLNQYFENINFFSNSWNYSSIINDFERFFIEKKIGYTYKSSEKSYKIEFKKDGIYLEGVKIPKGKEVFYISRSDGTKERINLLKKLTGRAFQILENEEIRLSYSRIENGKWDGNELSIPIKAETDGKNWKINIMDKDISVDYPILQDLFFYGNKINMSNYLPYDRVLTFISRIGIEKSELLEYLKRTQMLKALQGEK